MADYESRYTGYEGSEEQRRRRKSNQELLGLIAEGYRNAPADGGIGDQEIERAKRDKNMKVGGIGGGVVGGVVGGYFGGPMGATAGYGIGQGVGQLAGAQYDPFMDRWGDKLGVRIVPENILKHAASGGMAPLFEKRWKRIWDKNVDSGLRKTFRDADVVGKVASKVKDWF